jgi:hypothetical protein
MPLDQANNAIVAEDHGGGPLAQFNISHAATSLLMSRIAETADMILSAILIMRLR